MSSVYDFAVLCPGQGSQSPEMFDFALGQAPGRQVIDAFNDVLGFDLVARVRSGEQIFDNAFAQPALVAAALATWAVLAPELPTPALFAGYSVGEVSAWACAGAWDSPDCASVAVARARLMDARSPPDCGMLAVRGLRQDDTAALAGPLHIAIVNDVDHVVLAGDAALLAVENEQLIARGATTRRLDVRVPSHTPLLDEAALDFGAFLDSVPMREPSAPVLRGIDGRPCRRAADGRTALQQAVARTIRWDLCQREIAESGVRVLLELGPGRALTKMAADGAATIEARSVADFRSASGVVQWLLKRLDAS